MYIYELNYTSILRRLIKAIKQHICKHEYTPITLTTRSAYISDSKTVIAYTRCVKCDLNKIRTHSISRVSILKRTTCTLDKDLERFSWAIAGALARDVHGKRLSNHHLGWVD